MICKTAISYRRRQDLLDYLEAMRLPIESPKTEIVPTQDEEKKENENPSSPIDRLNDPSIYSPQIPFLIYDENKETIISRTTKGINEGKLNPFEVDWAGVTLYETHFVRDLLEGIDTNFVMDVAQAIDDEDKRHVREDGQFTNIAFDYYGTGQGSANFYSYMRDNWQNDSEYVSAGTIAEGILEKRKKAEEYKKKMEPPKNGLIAQTIFGPAPTVPVFDSDTEELLCQIDDLKDEVNQLAREKAALESSLSSEKEKAVREKNERNSKIEQLQKERKEWWKNYAEGHNSEPEKAFNVQTGMPCFTSRQMGILLTAIGRITEKENPPGKTTLGEIIEKIAGYKSTTASSNMRGEMPPKDTEAVATAIESKFPNLAAEVRKV